MVAFLRGTVYGLLIDVNMGDAMENSLDTDAVIESSTVRKCWTAPVLTEIGIADRTMAGSNKGADGLGTNTLS